MRYERPGWRLALSCDDKVCFAGCYEAYGLAAYSAETGEEIWRRKDLKSVQSVVASEVEDWVFCGRETGAAHVVEAATGKTLEKLTGVKEVYPSHFGKSVIVAGRELELHSPLGHKLAKFQRTDEWELQCAFSPSEFVLNEPGCLRCYDRKTQELLWRYEVPGEKQIPQLWFCETEALFVGRQDTLRFFHRRTGAVRREVTPAAGLGHVFGVCRRGSAVLASNLQLFSVLNGGLLADLATPELLAWDPEARMERFKELAASGRSPEELEQYMVSEGFAKNDVDRVLLMKYSNDRKKT